LKCCTNPKEEELTIMKFRRRPDPGTVTRAQIALQALLGLGVYGEIARLARTYGVSRQFVYQLRWQLLLFFELGFNPPPTPESVSQEIDRHILLLRMEGRCSLESISQIIRQLGLPFSSIGYISQRLQAYAQGLPQVALAGAVIMVILCDEIFTLGQPILITVEPRSLAILKIELVEKRDAETWKKHWEELVKAGRGANPLVVSDQGSGLVKGCELMGLTHHPDLFHLLQLLSGFEGRFYRQALKAISLEYERARVFESAKSARVIAERMQAYERAKAKAQKAIERFDNFSYLWRELRAALELFDSQGRLKPSAAREAEIKAILELMSQLGDEKLSAAVRSFAAGLEGYWDYYRRVEQRYQEWLKRYPAEVVQRLCLGWQAQRQATNSKDYGRRRQLEQAAAAYLAQAESLSSGGPELYQTIKREVLEGLEAEAPQNVPLWSRISTPRYANFWRPVVGK
jgi:hypothetical protein